MQPALCTTVLQIGAGFPSFSVSFVSVCFWFVFFFLRCSVWWWSWCDKVLSDEGVSDRFCRSGAGEVFQPSTLFFPVSVFHIRSYFLRFCSRVFSFCQFLVLVESLFSCFWSTTVVFLPLCFSVLFFGVLHCGSSGTGHTICDGDGLQILFEFCMSGFLVAQ
jgi:hypothetical protein